MTKSKVTEPAFPATQEELMKCVNNSWMPLNRDFPVKGAATAFMVSTQAPMLKGLMRQSRAKAGAQKVTDALNGSILLGRALQSGSRTVSQGIAIALEMFMTDDSAVIETAAVLICDSFQISTSASLEKNPDIFVRILSKPDLWYEQVLLIAILSSRKLNSDSKAISTKAVA